MGSKFKPVLLIDSREQLPYSFSRFSDQFSEIRKHRLLCGDYSILGWETKIAMERKSLSDLVSTIIHNRDRFKAELYKLAQYEHAAIVIEASLAQVSSPYSFSEANPKSVVGSLQAFSLLYNVHVVFADNRVLAEAWIANALIKYHAYSNPELP